MDSAPQAKVVIEQLLHKATQALESAQSELQAGRLDFAVNRAYYACFYAASAVMLQQGKQFVKHSGLRGAIHKDLIKAGKLAPRWGKVFDRAFENRQAADYLILFTFEAGQVEQLIQDGEAFVQAMQQLLAS
ncbi:MAG: HEPN domain-containing protein [Cyanobacteria bacterium P01_C01_bin.120]